MSISALYFSRWIMRGIWFVIFLGVFIYFCCYNIFPWEVGLSVCFALWLCFSWLSSFLCNRIYKEDYREEIERANDEWEAYMELLEDLEEMDEEEAIAKFKSYMEKDKF